MTNQLSGYVWPMPRNGQKRKAPHALRGLVAANVRRFMGRPGSGAPGPAELGKKAKVGKRTINRLLGSENSATLDTIEAVADALGVFPYELLLPSRGFVVEEETPPPESGVIPRRTARRTRG